MKLNSFAKILQHVKKSPRWVIIMTKHCQNLVTLSLKVTVSPTRRQISAQSYRVYLAPVFQSRTMSLRFSTSHSSSTLSPTSTRYTCMGVTHTNFALQQQALSGLYVVHRHGCYAYKFRTPAASSIRPLRGTPAWALRIQISHSSSTLSPVCIRYTCMSVTHTNFTLPHIYPVHWHGRYAYKFRSFRSTCSPPPLPGTPT